MGRSPIVLVAPPDSTAADLERAVDNLSAITGGVPVIVVPHGWTQARIDEEATRAAVVAEREACAKVAERFVAEVAEPGPVPGTFYGRPMPADAPEQIAARIRARGKVS